MRRTVTIAFVVIGVVSLGVQLTGPVPTHAHGEPEVELEEVGKYVRPALLATKRPQPVEKVEGSQGGPAARSDAPATVAPSEQKRPASSAPVSEAPEGPDDVSKQYVLRFNATRGRKRKWLNYEEDELPALRTYPPCMLRAGEDCCRRRDEGRPMIWDTFTFNGDWDMFTLRLGTLSPWVDMFVVVQSNLTFGGVRTGYVTRDDPRIANWQNCIRLVTVLSNGTDGPVHVNTVETADGQERWDDNSPWPQRTFRDAVELWFRDNTIYGYRPVGTRRGVGARDWVLFSDVDEIPDPRVVVWLIERHSARRWFYLTFKEYQYGYWNEAVQTAPASALINGKDATHLRMSGVYFHGRRGGSTDRCKGRPSSKKQLLVGHRKTIDTACSFASYKLHPVAVESAGWHCSNCFRSVERFLNKLCAFGWMLDLLSQRGYSPEKMLAVIKSGRIVHSTSRKQLRKSHVRRDGWSNSPSFASVHKDRFAFLMSPDNLTLGNFSGCHASRLHVPGT